MLLIGWCFMSLAMVAVWLIQRRTGDAGIVDVAWGLGVGLLALFFAFESREGDHERRITVALLTLIWSIRLSGYIFLRLLAHKEEDGRYQTLKANWGEAAQRKLFWFYQYQAIGALLFAIPMLVACRSTHAFFWLDFVGIAIWIIAVIGEGIADRQLAQFRAKESNRGKVCQFGLWRYSRHPNYFFEWLHWWAYVAFAWTAPWGWISLFAPLLMWYFIRYVTGIPPTEAQALKSRGDAYRDYQQTTNAFFPGPKRALKATPS